jgi:hypothetical protein
MPGCRRTTSPSPLQAHAQGLTVEKVSGPARTTEDPFRDKLSQRTWQRRKFMPSTWQTWMLESFCNAGRHRTRLGTQRLVASFQSTRYATAHVPLTTASQATATASRYNEVCQTSAPPPRRHRTQLLQPPQRVQAAQTPCHMPQFPGATRSARPQLHHHDDTAHRSCNHLTEFKQRRCHATQHRAANKHACLRSMRERNADQRQTTRAPTARWWDNILQLGLPRVNLGKCRAGNPKRRYTRHT